MGTIYDQIYQQLTGIQGDLTGGISESIEGLIKRTTDWDNILENVGETIGQSIIRATSDMLAQWIVTKTKTIALGKTFSAVRVGMAGAEAAVTTAS